MRYGTLSFDPVALIINVNLISWMWLNFYDNRCCFPTLGCLYNMVRLKHELWNRYGFFFDMADVIAEVFPDQ